MTSTTPPRVQATGVGGRILFVQQYTEYKSVYCGPAALQQWANYWGRTITQDDAAVVLQTGQIGGYNGTAWFYWRYPYPIEQVFPMERGMNAYAPAAYSGTYVAQNLPWNPSDRQRDAYTRRMVAMVNDGSPLVGNAEMVPYNSAAPYGTYQPQLQGFAVDRDFIIYHFVTVSGYLDYGETTTYSDPASGLPGPLFANVPQYGQVSTYDFFTIVANRGYVW